MRYLSVCSGIEAASVAWHHLDWTPAAFSEVSPFPSAVLKHRYPHVENLGDFTRIARDSTLLSDLGDVHLLVGGTPCQSFSVAGLRGGLSDERGNLALEFCRLAAALRPRWVLWENVPGALRTNGGRDFGAILGALGQLGYGFAWRVLDARYFGVAQKRRRLFLVGHLGGAAGAAQVLLESQGVPGNPPPAGPQGTGRWWTGEDVSQTLDAVLAKGQMLPEKARFPVVRERARSFGESAALVLQVLRKAGYSHALADGYEDLRRLTPLECERLQGFPDGWTDIPKASDSARYKAIGNSMAVPVMRWIGERIAAVEAQS